MHPNSALLQQVGDVTRRLSDDVSLDAMAGRAARSRFQFHRQFQRMAGETLKQYTLRLRLERAAARLVAHDHTVIEIALAVGFASHEVFTRAFRRYFGVSPTHYRERIRARTPKAQRLRHLQITESAGPCVRLFHCPMQKSSPVERSRNVTVLSIVRKDIPEQPILFIRRRIVPGTLKDVLAECFGKLFTYGATAGLPIAGWPLCRYSSAGRGLWTVEPAMPLAAPAADSGEMQAGVLPGGPVALGVHGGPYEGLPQTNAAIEQWIEANGYKVGGAPWEQYVTDPGEHPNPADWRTEVYWPLAK
jgi:AraC family transcriptional regulator